MNQGPVALRYAYHPRVNGQRYLVPPGVLEVRSRTDATDDVPEIANSLGYERILILASRTLNRSTPVVDRLAEVLGARVVARTDQIGEHAPLGNVVAALELARRVRADAVLSVGGGSVLDFAKFVQLGLAEGVVDSAGFRALQESEGPGPSKEPTIGHIAIPTTFATAEWTPAGTPLDDETGKKIFLWVPNGVPQAIVYDSAIVALTPPRLLLSTGIRGLDHAINSVCSVSPNEFSTELALLAIAKFSSNLPGLLGGSVDQETIRECQVATWCTGMGQMSAPHGFSHFMVHLLAPWAKVSHADAACVMMLAQARWFVQSDDPRLLRIAAAMGQAGRPLDEVLDDLLARLGLPRSLADLGVDPARLVELLEPALRHPYICQNNLRPIPDAEALLAVFDTVAQ